MHQRIGSYADCNLCRRAGLEQKLRQEQYSEEEKGRIIEESEQRERDFTRLQRQRLSIADFEPLTIIGRGAFGEVSMSFRGAYLFLILLIY